MNNMCYNISHDKFYSILHVIVVLYVHSGRLVVDYTKLTAAWLTFFFLHSTHLFLKNAIDTVRRQDHQSTNAHGDRYRSATNQHQLTHCNTLNNYTCRIAMISRDLYSLIGGAPPIAFVKPTFKAKYNDKKKATSWYCFIYMTSVDCF